MKYCSSKVAMFMKYLFAGLNGVLLKKDEAEKILKEVSDACKRTRINSISLSPPLLDDPLSKGYQIQIRAESLDFSMSVLVPIIEKHSLSFCVKEGQIVIYKPHPIYLKRT